MTSTDHRHLERITCLAWTEAPRAARREPARAMGELAAAIRRRVRDALSGSRRAEPLSGAA